jgi:hypothetical protein
MPKSKSQPAPIQVLPKIIQLINSNSGLGAFNVEGLTLNKCYQPIGSVYHDYGDGSASLCFILIDDRSKVRTVDVSKFEVIVEGEKPA